MQVKNQICTERSSTDDPEQDENQKKTSCFSNIKIFLVSECALMLAQGTVGAYLVSMSLLSGDRAADTQTHFPRPFQPDPVPQLPRGALTLMTGCVFATRPMRILRQRVTASAAQPAQISFTIFGCAQLLEGRLRNIGAKLPPVTCAPLTPSGSVRASLEQHSHAA